MLHKVTTPPLMPALFGTLPRTLNVARQAPPSPGLEAVSLLKGLQAADCLLAEIKTRVVAPNALRDLVEKLAGDPGALEGACRCIQKALEGAT